MKKFLLTWVKLFTLFLVIMFFMFVIHESSHALVCKFNGFKPSLLQIMPHPLMQCEGIVDNGLVISPFNYFIYAIIPYMIGLLILFFLYNKKGFLVFPVSFVILLDASYNFLISPFRLTDFTRLAIVNKWLFLVSVLIVFIEWLLGYFILKKNFKYFKKWVRKSLNQ